MIDKVSANIGKFARPDGVIWADALPKTPSGKIMRRLPARLAAGETEPGDVTTLEDAAVLATLRDNESDEE